MSDHTPSGPPPIWALLVGINEYEGGVRALRGCVNDVRAMQKFLLETMQVPPAQIRVLTSPPLEPDGTRPTRAAILQAFKSFLIENEAIPEGAQILFHFSGHGSQMPDWTGTEPDGQNETLVAQDSRLPGHYDIPDKTLAAMLERLAERRGASNLTVILDSCHSGSATRDLSLDGVASTRFHPADERRPPPDLDAEWLQGESARPTGGSGWAQATARVPYVLLAGCRDSEEAAELALLLDEQGDGEMVTHGAMSYFLLDYLTHKLTPTTTYRDLHEAVAAKVAARFPRQMPQCEGQRERTIFGGATIHRDPFLSVREVHKGGQVTLDGGVLHGLRVGTRLALYPPDTRRADEAAAQPPLATVEVLSASATSAQARPVEPAAASIPLLARALVTDSVQEGARLRIALHAQPDATGRAIPANEQAVERFLAEVGGRPSPYLQVVAPDAAPDAHVRAEAGAWHVYDAAGEPLLQPSDLAQQASAAALRHALEGIARWRALLALANAEPSPYDGQISIGLRRVADNTPMAPGDEGLTLLYDPEQPEQSDYYVEVTNSSFRPCFAHIFVMSTDYSIMRLYPTEGQQEALPPDHTLQSRPESGGSILQVWLPGSEDGGQWDISRDFIKVLVTEQPADLALLEQGALQVPPPRGGMRGAAPTALEMLIEEVGAGTRHVRRRQQVGEAWEALTFPLTVLRATTTTQLAAGATSVPLADGLTLHKPATFTGSVSVGTLDQSTRGAGDPSLRPPPGLEANPHFQPLRRSDTRGTGSAALVLTFDGADDAARAAISPDSPLRLELGPLAAPDADALLPIAFDGEDYLVVGRGLNGGTAVEISTLPEGQPTTRGIGRTVRLFLYKKMGRHNADLGLRRATLDEQGAVRYAPVSPDQFQAGQRVALFLHGFTSDSAWMISGPARLLEGVGVRYDHLLTWDYESFGTGVAENGEALALALRQQAGLGPDDGITVDLFAHSMGGFLARCMIELSGGHQMVDRAFFAGVPSNGTTLASTVHGGAFLLSAALNQAAVIPLAGSLGKLLDAFREQGPGLADLRVGSDLVRRLNALAEPSTVAYYVLAGENEGTDPDASRMKRLASKLLDQSLDSLFGEQNDVIIGLSSMTGVRNGAYPGLSIQRVPSDHFHYFAIPETRAALKEWLT